MLMQEVEKLSKKVQLLSYKDEQFSQQEERKCLTQEYQVEKSEGLIGYIQEQSISFDISLLSLNMFKDIGLHLKLDELILPKVCLAPSQISTLQQIIEPCKLKIREMPKMNYLNPNKKGPNLLLNNADLRVEGGGAH